MSLKVNLAEFFEPIQLILRFSWLAPSLRPPGQPTVDAVAQVRGRALLLRLEQVHFVVVQRDHDHVRDAQALIVAPRLQKKAFPVLHRLAEEHQRHCG